MEDYVDFALTCPECGHLVDAKYIGYQWNQPTNYTGFFGEAGRRKGICRGKVNPDYLYTHFVVQLPDGRLSHRVMYHKVV